MISAGVDPDDVEFATRTGKVRITSVCLRPVREWAALPRPQHRRRRHQGMPGRNLLRIERNPMSFKPVAGHFGLLGLLLL